MTTRVLAGPGVLDRLGDALDELHRATQTPVTARRPWLQTWSDCYPGFEPLAVVVDGPDRRLDGAALLAVKTRRWGLQMVGMGHGPSDQLRLPARDRAAAMALSEAVCRFLRRVASAWTLRIAQLPENDSVAALVADGLKAASIVPGVNSPTTRFRDDRRLRAHVSKNHHQQVRRMMNKMSRDGLEPTFRAHRDPDLIAGLLPEIERVCRARDHQLGRRSKLDDPSAGPFFRRIIIEAAARGEVELITLDLDTRLAAYVLSFLDDGAYRMWNCRFDPDFERYGVGRVANDHALGRALADHGAREFDWMKGEEGYKASLATDVVPAVDLLSWSSPAVRTVMDRPRSTKQMIKRWTTRSEPLARLVARVRR